ILCGLIVSASAWILAWNVFTITDPYLVKPLASSDAGPGASQGHAVQAGNLVVISTTDVVVVADPGASFAHEVLWLVEQPRADETLTLREYVFQSPPSATVNQIHPSGTPIPANVQRVADGGW